nr:hypothetical protein [Tanacetum cinerariifolium]
MPSHKATTSIEENIQAPQEVKMVNKPDISKAEIENNKEDVELPSLNLVATITKDIIITPLKESGIEHSRRLALITNEVDEPTETDEATGSEEIKVADNSWITCGIREYGLLLTRKVNSGYGHINLEANLHFATTAASMSAQPKGNTFMEKGTQNHYATDYCVQTQAEQAQRQPFRLGYTQQ